jgi:hypothetical protein
MAVPYREWTLFQHFGVYRTSADNTEDRPHWNAGRLEYGKCGMLGATGPLYSEWKTVARPTYDFDYDSINLNLLVDFEVDVLYVLNSLVGATSHVHAYVGAQANPVSPALWDSALAEGIYYDGVNYWCLIANVPFYPTGNAWATTLQQYNSPFLPTTFRTYGCSYKAALGPEVWMSKYEYEHHGLCVQVTNYSPANPVPVGEQALFNCVVKRLKYIYLNPVVNSLSTYSVPVGGGATLILTGLGFNNVDTEVSDVAKNPSTSVPPAGGWNDEVYHIQFIGLNGQGTTTLHGHLGDFVVNSNAQITIVAMPALTAGTYEIYLIKDKLNIGGGFGGFGPGYAYAGDWRAKADGRLYRGQRITLCVGCVETKRKKPTVFTKWKFKKFGGEVFKYYAPIDTITPSVFYDGRILSLSAFNRAVSEKTGLYVCSDMDITLANQDKEFSKLLAEYFLKNQIIEIFVGWQDEPASWMEYVSKLVVDDYSRQGALFKAKLRDITTKYFKRKIPLYRCTASEYPNIHKNHVNRMMPEVIGNASLTTSGQGGACEAVCVDTVAHKYLLTRGSLYSVTAVYSEGVVCSPTGYSISYADGGRTYCTFTADMKDAKITFDAQGYTFPLWDSVNGYVQNPSYVLAFFLSMIVEVPIDLIDLDSIDALATMLLNAGEGASGYLVIQKEQDAESIIQELLFTIGAMSTFDIYGRFYMERKDLSVLSTNLYIFSQIDTMELPDFVYGLKNAVNRIRYRWNYCPGQEVFVYGAEASRASSIADFEEELEASDFIDFRWTTSSAWAAMRAEEELQKWGYGQPEINFEVASPWIEELDVLTNFRLQDPFGASKTGAGEVGRYCYVAGMNADLLAGRIGIRAVDLNWLIRQYLILGDELSLPDAWINTTEEQRIYAYLCDEVTGRFSDGENGKKLVDENLIY